jgi:hypothetical protein
VLGDVVTLQPLEKQRQVIQACSGHAPRANGRALEDAPFDRTGSQLPK